jgi:hypothetical protein
MSDIPSSLSAQPLPPPIQAAPPQPGYVPASATALSVRVWSLFTIGIAGSMLGMGLWLRPSPLGHSTHMELGLPPCGFMERYGYPCPTCGCTTAVSYFSHGHLVDSFLTQPFGFAVGVLAVAAIILCAIGAVTGRWVGPDSFSLGWHWRKWVFSGLAIFIGGWIYKIIVIRMQLHPF